MSNTEQLQSLHQVEARYERLIVGMAFIVVIETIGICYLVFKIYCLEQLLHKL